jgi:hypothetical protein
MWTIALPTSVPVSKNQRFSLNLNQYRNAHHYTLHAAKVAFHELVKGNLHHLPRCQQVNLTYHLFVGSRQLVDTPNVCSIVDKFFSDCLVTEGIIEDDNYTVVLSSSYRFGGFEKGNPRVEVTIEPVGSTWVRPGPEDPQCEGNPPMKITLVQTEIEKAISDYVLGQMTINESMELAIDLSATRGPEGMTAEIIISPKADVTMPARKTSAVTAAGTPRAKPGPKPKVAQEAAEQPQESQAQNQQDEARQEPVAEAQPDPEQETEQEAVGVEAEIPAQPRSSIFGNLQRPVNS